MNLTDDRINHLSHLVLAGLKKGGGAKIPDETAALNGIKKALRGFASLLETLDGQIRQKIASLKRVKEDVKEVQKGFECGIVLEGQNDVKEGDLFQAYDITYIEQEL